MKYMPERKLICSLGKKLWEKGWVAGNDGNLSMRCDKDRFLITPTGVSKGEMTPDMILLVDSEGEKLDDLRGYSPKLGYSSFLPGDRLAASFLVR